MQVMSVASTTAAAESAGQKQRQPTIELGQDAFMQLLLAQLRYQDPLTPMDDREFITQLAQFSSLSEIQKLNETMTQMASVQGLADATSFIGKTVFGLGEDGAQVTGAVEAALLRDGKVYLRVAGQEVAATTIQEVTLGGSSGQPNQ